MSAAAQTVVSILETFPEKPTSADMMLALARAERAGAARLHDQLQVRNDLLRTAVVWLETAGDCLTATQMPKTGAGCSEKATEIRAFLDAPKGGDWEIDYSAPPEIYTGDDGESGDFDHRG